MHTAADLWSAWNGLFLDLAPVAAIIALGVSWFLRKKRLDREESGIRGRIETYRSQKETGPADSGEET